MFFRKITHIHIVRLLLSVLLPVSLLGLLSACQAGYDDKLDDYLGRIENIVDLTINSQNLPKTLLKLPTLPNRKSTQNIPQFEDNSSETIGILAFLSLNECAVQQTIAEKNNSLGKVATTSQQLLNLIQFLSESPACQATLKESHKTDLLKKLVTSAQQKQQQLPFLLWQATLNEKEYRSFWKTSNIDTKYPETLPPKQSEALEDLFQFNRSVLENTETSVALEETLGTLRHGDGGQLLSAYIYLHNKLEVANQLLEQALKKPFCYPENPHPKVNILKNTINKFFIPEIQRLSNDLNQRLEKIMPKVQQLEELQPNREHPAFKAWRIERNHIFKLARKATKKHVLIINKLYVQCALKPGKQAD